MNSDHEKNDYSPFSSQVKKPTYFKSSNKFIWPFFPIQLNFLVVNRYEILLNGSFESSWTTWVIIGTYRQHHSAVFVFLLPPCFLFILSNPLSIIAAVKMVWFDERYLVSPWLKVNNQSLTNSSFCTCFASLIRRSCASDNSDHQAARRWYSWIGRSTSYPRSPPHTPTMTSVDTYTPVRKGLLMH